MYLWYTTPLIYHPAWFNEPDLRKFGSTIVKQFLNNYDHNKQKGF